MSGRARRPGDARPIKVVVEYDGLLQRFGRAVPEAVALLDQLRELRRQALESGRRLEIAIVRFGDGSDADLAGEVEAAGLAEIVAEAGVRLRMAAQPAAVRGEDPAVGVLLFCGREETAGLALDARIPAYVTSDRRLPDHRRLAVAEAQRVASESLGLATPRPMSDESRRGSLIAVAAGSPAEARARSLAAIRRDPRADWFGLGRWQIFHVGDEDARAELMSGSDSRCLAENVRTAEIFLERPPVAAHPGGGLLEEQGLRLSRSEGVPKGLPWPSLRRRRLGRARAAEPLRRETRKLGRDRLGTDESTEWSMVAPYGAEGCDSIVALFALGGACSRGEELVHAAASSLLPVLSDALLVALLATHSTEEAIERLLWQGEANRLRAVVEVRSGAEIHSANLVPRRHDEWAPLIVSVGLPLSPGDSREIEALAGRVVEAVANA